MADVGVDRIVVRCACGAKLKVAAQAAGRTGQCPKCHQKFTVPHAAAAPARAPTASPATDEGAGWLDDLAAKEHAAAATGPAAGLPAGGGMPRPCPHCGATLVGGAVLCTSCGYNAQTGRIMKAAALGPGAAAVASKAAQWAGTFVLGCVLSLVGAAIGAALWCFIAYKTGYEVGYVAWGIGLITGFGMALGSRMSGVLPGVVAATVALLAIIVAKILLAVVVLAAILTGDTSNTELKKAYVMRHVAAEVLTEQGVDPEQATDAQWERAGRTAERRVEAMKKAELERAIERYRADDEAAAQVAAGDQGPAAEQPTPDRADVELAAGEDIAADDGPAEAVGEMFWALFGFMDVVFILLALSTAYKVGSSGLAFAHGSNADE